MAKQLDKAEAAYRTRIDLGDGEAAADLARMLRAAGPAR